MALAASPPPAGNNLIGSLSRAHRLAVLSACEEVELRLSHLISEANTPLRHVYFPTTAYISLITPKGTTDSLEVGMVGNEGMLGVALLLDIRKSPLDGLVQGAGIAYRMSAPKFMASIRAIPSWRRTLNHYLYFLTEQIGQTAVCNRFHPLDARLARWLLMTADRAHGDQFRLTHKFLAYMLGVRRAGVTEAAGRLQAKNLIHYARGEMTVVDHGGLLATACPCYRLLNEMYAASVGITRTASASANSWT